MSDFKPAKPATFDQFQQPARRASGFGCLGVGCLVTVILLVLMCVGSYYAMMHTSMPLSLIKSAIESEGNARVEGLRGSVSSGFEMDKLEFASDDPEHWNELRDVRFRFNGLFDLMRNQRLIIEEATIGGATIYARFDEPVEDEQGDFEIDWAGISDDNEFKDIRGDLRDENFRELAELRIDLVGAREIELVNPDTDSRLRFERVEFRNFLMLHGEIEGLGEIVVDSDQLDLVTTPSTVYPDGKLACKLVGTAKPPLHKLLVAELPFAIDAAVGEDDRLLTTISVAADALLIEDMYGDQTSWKLNDFSPGDFFDLRSTFVPAHWRGSFVSEVREVDAPPTDAEGDATIGDDAEANQEKLPEEKPDARPEGRPGKTGKSTRKNAPSKKDRNRFLTVEPGTSFQLNETRFDLESATRKLVTGGGEPFVATGQLEGETITARLTLREKQPFTHLELSAPEQEARNIWSRIFFEKPFAELDEAEQRDIDAAISGTPATSPANPDEPADEE